MTNNLIILAAGASSRMKKGTASNLSQSDIDQANNKTKGLIELSDGHPLLDFLLFNAAQAGFKNIYFVIGANSDEFKELYSHRRIDSFENFQFKYATQEIPEGRHKPLGTADAVQQTLEQFPNLQIQEFVVCNSDNLYSINVLEKLSNTTAPNALIAYSKTGLNLSAERISKFAILEIEKGQLKSIIEKPELNKINEFKGEDGKVRVSMNIFKFSGKDIYPFLKTCQIHPERNEKELPTAIMNMINESDATIRTIPVNEQVPDLTSKEDISKLREYILENYGKIKW